MRLAVRWLAVCVVLAATALVAGSAARSATQTNIRATVITIPPKVQAAGKTYRLRVRVINRGATFKPLCVDFTDDNDSWLIETPMRLVKFDSDTFCAGTFKRRQTKTLTFFVIAARTGAHRMSLTIGKATVFRSLNDAIIDDPGALVWEGNFVII
jgi:hypothetical protein